MQGCNNCNDQVCWRSDREGIIHKNGLYACRRKPGEPITVAEVPGPVENRLRVAASVKLPEEPPTVRKGHKREEWTDD